MKAQLCAAVVVLSCSLAAGQQYKVLSSFAGSPNDGDTPLSNLTFDHSGNLYGTTRFGGSATASCSRGCGTVFKLSSNGNGSWTETVLYSFCQSAGNPCADGVYPEAGLLLDAQGNLYGSTYSGGSQPCPFLGSGCGTIFKLSPSPGAVWNETVLYDFCSDNVGGQCLDGALPISQLTADASGNLYGTTSTGGTGGDAGACCAGGTVFELSHSKGGWSESVIYNFCANGGPICPDGVGPQAGVKFDQAGNLYGTTERGGAPKSAGAGAIYQLSPGPSGWTETVLLADRYPFHAASGPLGAVSFDALGKIYTTFGGGGPNNAGGVVKLVPGGRHKLFWFNGKDGNEPTAGVLVDSKNSALYGTTSGGGFIGGTVFKISSPAQETVLYTFCSQPSCTDGLDPVASLVKDKSGNLYGTTKLGGANNLGVVFEIVQSLPEQKEYQRQSSKR